jgi:hypothetical protein
MGRIAISAFLAAVIALILISNIPLGTARVVANRPINPVLEATGLGQGWYLFAPNPARRTTRLAAVVRFADGSSTTWTPPTSNRFLGAYRDYRWRGLDGAAQLHAAGAFWPELARWLIAQHQKPGGPRITQVVFFRGIAETPRPGSTDEARWVVEKLSTFEPTDAGGRR